MMTNEAEKQEAELDFSAQASRDRSALQEALAALTARSVVMLEVSLLVEHAAQMREHHDRKASDATHALVVTARNETKRALQAVGRACGVML